MSDLLDQTIIKNKIFREQIQILHKNLFLSIPANLICAATVFAGLLIADNKYIIYWFTAVILASIIRLLGYYIYKKDSGKNSTLHLFIFILGLSISAILWGIVDSILMPTSLTEQMIVIVIIAGVTAGGAQTLNANLLSSLIYIVTIIAPLCIWFTLQQGITYVLLTITLTTYMLFMVIASIRGHKLLTSALKLKYENQALVENLSSANTKLAESYAMLEKHENEITLINKMNDMLQSCKTLNEAYPIINFTAKELFENISGAIVIYHAETKQFETINQWGDEQSLVHNFTADSCWAIRKGRNYFVNDSNADLVCSHFNNKPIISICIPLYSQQNNIGLFVLHSTKKSDIIHFKPELATNFCEVIQLSLSNIQLRERLLAQATHDPLTGLFNRRYLDETLNRELHRIKREKNSLCVAMIDLDHFKNFNDDYGHDAGDVVLKLLGIVLNKNFRGSDVACRYGGEEFTILMLNSKLSNAYQRLEELRKEIQTEKIFFNNVLLPNITISIGIAEAPTHGNTTNAILNAADHALYKAKQAGRNRVEKASEEKSIV